MPLDNDITNADQRFMRVALELAQRGRGWVEPNPMVGCVIVRDGLIIAKGYHRQFGGPHAEIDAISSLASVTDAKDAIAYVTLEPCCHQGKTPPCSRALIDAGFARVVVAMEDPFPSVDGGGIRHLRDAGVETSIGVLREEALALNAPYLKKVRAGKPWVIAKWAMTIDGRIATVAGESQWITGEASRREVHRLRARVDAIAVGMGTVQADDPMLTARLPEPNAALPRVATRVVFCRHRVPSIQSRLVRSAREFPLMLLTSEQIDADRTGPIESQGAKIVRLRTNQAAEMVESALDVMGSRGMTNVMLEGGGELLASFFSAGQIDECHVYVGAKAFGGRQAHGPIGGPGIESVADAWRFRLVSVDQFDDDLRAVYRKTDS
jgi:diaminohydroxyphosphoribosylaminopyrimidine deaminase/5-amino-6-(5-phosphoribosylamino)uracil reductase